MYRPSFHGLFVTVVVGTLHQLLKQLSACIELLYCSYDSKYDNCLASDFRPSTKVSRKCTESTFKTFEFTVRWNVFMVLLIHPSRQLVNIRWLVVESCWQHRYRSAPYSERVITTQLFACFRIPPLRHLPATTRLVTWYDHFSYRIPSRPLSYLWCTQP
jgi:hypothetical protein